MPKKTLFVAQLTITFMMSFSMSGIMSFIAIGPTMDWLYAWPVNALTAWPIAFGLTQIVTPLAFFAATRLTIPKKSEKA
jgi:hypothetical protein